MYDKTVKGLLGYPGSGEPKSGDKCRKASRAKAL